MRAAPLPTLPPRALASGGEGGRRRRPGGGAFRGQELPPTPSPPLPPDQVRGSRGEGSLQRLISTEGLRSRASRLRSRKGRPQPIRVGRRRLAPRGLFRAFAPLQVEEVEVFLFAHQAHRLSLRHGRACPLTPTLTLP